MAKESMPLAVGYIKAMVQADTGLAADVDMRICNLSGGQTIASMAQTLFADEVPDVLAFSVLGWNFRAFGCLAETFRQLNSSGLVVFGGNHVANQGSRVFRLFPDVDIVVNGEGELTFPNLLRRYLARLDRHDFGGVKGLTYRTADGEIVGNPDQERIADLETIPSPFLTGAIEMADHKGEFRYDVALMETNRGCPYSCAFCYWGGATGQKIRRFSNDRLREELELFGRLKVPSIVLCDANFAVHRHDLEFVETFIRTREKFGFPRTLDTSWAKNKSQVFYSIVKRMKEAGLRSSFTLALQTMTEPALELMNRNNMKINDWRDLVEWLAEEGLECYAELIWGAPGDSYAEFLDGYDRLAQHTSRIAVYPLQVLPNTAYDRDRAQHGFVTVRGEDDDFEYVLGHGGSTLQDNRRMQHFLFWARSIAEHMFFRHIWTPLRVFAGLSQSQVLARMAAWFDRRTEPELEFLRFQGNAIVRAEVVSDVVRRLYREPRMARFFRAWWDEDIVPLLAPDEAEAATAIFEYDQVTRAIFDEGGGPATVDLSIVTVRGLEYYRREVRGAVDAAQLSRDILGGAWRDRPLARRDTTLYYRSGFHIHVDSHEVAIHYFGKTLDELEVTAGRAAIEAAMA